MTTSTVRRNLVFVSGYELHEAIRLWLVQKIDGEDRTQAKVARALGVKQERLHHWLTGRNRVPLDKLRVIASYFKFESEPDLLLAVRRAYPTTDARPSPPEVVRASQRATRAATPPRRQPSPARTAGGRK